MQSETGISKKVATLSLCSFPNEAVTSEQQNRHGRLCPCGSVSTRSCGSHRNNKREVFISTCCNSVAPCTKGSQIPQIHLGPLLPFRSAQTLTKQTQITLYNQLFFFQSLYAWHMILFSSTPEIFKTPKAPKDHLSKLPREKKFRHPPTYSISDFTRKYRRSGNGHNWDYYWHQEGRRGGHYFFYPRVELEIPYYSIQGTCPLNRTGPPFDNLYSPGNR